MAHEHRAPTIAVAMMNLFDRLGDRDRMVGICIQRLDQRAHAARRHAAWLQAFPDPARHRRADAASEHQPQPRRVHLWQVLPANAARLGDLDYH
jgi:hypothetical protein